MDQKYKLNIKKISFKHKNKDFTHLMIKLIEKIVGKMFVKDKPVISINNEYEIEIIFENVGNLNYPGGSFYYSGLNQSLIQSDGKSDKIPPIEFGKEKRAIGSLLLNGFLKNLSIKVDREPEIYTENIYVIDSFAIIISILLSLILTIIIESLNYLTMIISILSQKIWRSIIPLNLLNNPEKITAYATVALFFITAWYSYLVKKTLEDTQKSRKITSIERRLEFYYSLQNIFKKFDIYSVSNDIEIVDDKTRNIGDRATLFQSSILGRYYSLKEYLDQIVPFLYLASGDLKQLLDKFIENFENDPIFKETRNKDSKFNDYQKLCEILDKYSGNLNKKKTDIINSHKKIEEEINKEINYYNSELNKLLE